MGRFLDLALLLFSLQATTAWGQAGAAVEEELESPASSPNVHVTATAIFPDEEIFGIKVVNGQKTKVQISFTNEEPEPVTVQFVGGSLWTPDFDPSGSRIIRNLTASQYALEIPAGEKESLAYYFSTNMQPQELRLALAAVVSKQVSYFTVQAFNGTVSVVDPDSSIFDPQIIFLYIFLLACTVGVAAFFYNIWIAPYFPQKKKAGKRVAPKKIEAADVDVDSSATASGAATYNSDWIPAHHIQRPEAKRVKSSGRPKSRQGKE